MHRSSLTHVTEPWARAGVRRGDGGLGGNMAAGEVARVNDFNYCNFEGDLNENDNACSALLLVFLQICTNQSYCNSARFL